MTDTIEFMQIVRKAHSKKSSLLVSIPHNLVDYYKLKNGQWVKVKLEVK